MFKTNPARTWLTILGMGVGTSAVVMLVGLGFGLQNILLEKIVFGDTLSGISLRYYGTANRWREIFAANRANLRDELCRESDEFRLRAGAHDTRSGASYPGRL